MNNKIETEKKYYSVNNNELIRRINKLGYKLVSEEHQSDEYFTDINSEYIRKRTCLRIRKVNNKNILTFKGESKDFDSSFTKLNLSFNTLSSNYDNLIDLFSMMGYFSYVLVDKNRQTYERNDGTLTYSIMVDSIEDLGDFIEFEISSSRKNIEVDTLREKLNQFVSKFSCLCLEEAYMPYRDYVALKEYNLVLPSKGIKGVHINVDEFLKDYEKDFYNYFKNVMKSENINIKIKDYKDNKYSLNKEIETKINSYFDNLIIQDSMLIVTFSLLKQLKEKGLEVIMSTNGNYLFINSLLNKISNNVVDKKVYLNNSKTIYSVLSKNDIDIKNYFNVCCSSLKETNSLLLIIINNYSN